MCEICLKEPSLGAEIVVMSMRLDFLDFLEEVVLEEVVDLVDLVLFGFPV